MVHKGSEEFVECVWKAVKQERKERERGEGHKGLIKILETVVFLLAKVIGHKIYFVPFQQINISSFVSYHRSAGVVRCSRCVCGWSSILECLFIASTSATVCVGLNRTEKIIVKK